jgi:hypothetical protein
MRTTYNAFGYLWENETFGPAVITTMLLGDVQKGFAGWRMASQLS